MILKNLPLHQHLYCKSSKVSKVYYNFLCNIKFCNYQFSNYFYLVFIKSGVFVIQENTELLDER